MIGETVSKKKTTKIGRVFADSRAVNDDVRRNERKSTSTQSN